jgi:hypothetical protein
MRARASIAIDHDAQIIALWIGRSPHQRTVEDVGPFYDWLVSFAPWLVGVSTMSVDRVRRIVEPHSTSSDDGGGRNCVMRNASDTQRAI